MKIFAYIVSFIVIALTVNPCIDGLKDNVLQKSEISQSSNNNNHQNDSDHCSPFCTCQCCQTTFFVSDGAPVSPAGELLFNYTQYSSNFKSLDPSELLIPPKA